MNHKIFLLIFIIIFTTCNSNLSRKEAVIVNSLNKECSFNGHPIVFNKNNILNEFGIPTTKQIKAGCFIPYSIAQQKKSYKSNDCINYDKYSFNNFEYIIFKKYAILFYIDFRTSDNYLIVSTFNLSSNTSYSDVKNAIHEDLAFNEGLNMLIDKDEDYFNENKDKLSHCYVKLEDIISVQLVFENGKLAFAFFLPNTATFL